MLEVLAPAKINLGLEILRKRDDGYHDLRTVFAAVSLFDRLTFAPSTSDQFLVDRNELQSDNLVVRTRDLWDESGFPRPCLEIRLSKRIPAASGLGGASSDAASTLLALNQLSDSPVNRTQLQELGSRIGSDVPFFLEGGRALAGGRGEHLESLPARPFSAVIITPEVIIDSKTKSMFAALSADDFTDGSQVERVASSHMEEVRKRCPLINTFQRPLFGLYPELDRFAQEIHTITGRYPSLSGAGPSMFILCESIDEAHSVKRTLVRSGALGQTEIHAVRSLATRAPIECRHA